MMMARQTLFDDAKFLTQFYIEARYPGDLPDFTIVDAQKAFEATKRIKEFVLQKLEHKRKN
jgi:HEPN domain-containing protein